MPTNKTLNIMTNLEIWAIKLIGVVAMATPFILGSGAFPPIICLIMFIGGFICYCVGNIILRENREKLEKKNSKLSRTNREMFDRIVSLESEIMYLNRGIDNSFIDIECEFRTRDVNDLI